MTNSRLMKIAEILSKIDPDNITFDELVSISPIRWRRITRLAVNSGILRGTFAQNSDGTYKFLG